MKEILKQIKPLTDENNINVIIEIQKGSKNKYEFDKETGMIMLDRVMHTSQDYPFDYGFVPNTLWHDGDPLDVVLLTTYPLLPGVLVEARPLAVMDMIDSGEGDAKIVAVPVGDPRFKNMNDISDINPHTLKEIEHFFCTYKSIQNKVCTIEKVEGKEAALKAVKDSIDLANK
ncbi:MAG: inorganic pyrophosphatase [Patescibacteria group bacterium]|nr:inorganic pyrophosphatase [Patescibacteria group bacterium]